MTPQATFEFTKSTFEKGVGEIHLKSWMDFVTYIHEAIVPMPDFIWRGQRSESWPLQPSLERVLSSLKVPLDSKRAELLRFNQLDRFKLSARGRLDPRDLEERDIFSEQPPQNDGTSDNSENAPLGPSSAEREENNWWAVGQHYGLNTPLLDWSTSPFVSAFFAFSQPTPQTEKSGGRAIYGLDRTLVSQRSDEIREAWNSSQKTPTIDFVEPLYKDNPRLVSQGGLFTRSPNGQTVREWVEANYQSIDEGVWLLKIVLPDNNREYILRALNRMNINHQALFPDLYGATEFVNLKLALSDY